MDQDYHDSRAKNVVIREGAVALVSIANVDGGIIRWNGKEYILKDLLEIKDGGCIDGCQSGDCQCNHQVSRCCP